MENENHFSQQIEQEGIEPKIHLVRFDRSHFGDREIDPKVVRDCSTRGDSWIPGAIDRWWAQICAENNLNPDEDSLQYFIYHLIEVARNAFEKVGSGELKVTLEPKRIIVVVQDQGQGFGDANNVHYAMAMGHGLSEVKKYADEFIIETNGRKYTKTKDESRLVESQDTDIQQGAKITFTKTFE